MPPDRSVERRSKPRIEAPIPATVRGCDRSGEPFQAEATLDNLSMTGLHVRLERELQAGSSLYALIRFAGMEIETTGIVKRAEPLPDGWFGFGVAFERYHLVSKAFPTGCRPGSET